MNHLKQVEMMKCLLKRNERIIEVYNEFAQNPTILNVLKAMVYTYIARRAYSFIQVLHFSIILLEIKKWLEHQQ